jgi:glycosyltransferase involved in cell wall biosynthesis
MSNFSSISYEPLVIVSNALSGGGAEKSMLALHQEFLKKGIISYLIVLNKTVSVNDVENIKELNRKWKDGLRSTLLNFLDFKNTIAKINPKTVIVNCELPELYISLLKSRKMRVICVEHTSVPWHNMRFIGVCVRLLLKYRKVEWVTVVRGKKEIWISSNISKYIANPYIGFSNNLKISEAKPSLVFIGGIKKNKRPDWVIEAGIINNLSVHLYGEGQLIQTLKAKYSNLVHNIEFHGFKSNVWDLIPSNSLVVVPSEFEGDGMVIIEAIISRFPLVLAWNKDLIKFGLEEKHYFRTLHELILIVEQNLENNFKNLVVEDKFVASLNKQRSLELIVSDWISLLKKSDLL